MPEVTATIDSFNPTEGNLLCEPVEEAAKSSGGIWIPDSAKVSLSQAVVLKAGSMCDQEIYCPGRLIIFQLHTESTVNIGEESYVIVQPCNVQLTGPIVPKKEIL